MSGVEVWGPVHLAEQEAKYGQRGCSSPLVLRPMFMGMLRAASAVIETGADPHDPADRRLVFAEATSALGDNPNDDQTRVWTNISLGVLANEQVWYPTEEAARRELLGAIAGQLAGYVERQQEGVE